MTDPGCTRRRLLGGLALLGGVFAWPRGLLAADAFPHDVTIMVAGPVGGVLDQAAHAMLPGLVAGLPPNTAILRRPVGGLDGVTGANAFMAQATLDGGTALLVPGAASLAWLAGDNRVHFDPSRWLAVLASTMPGFLVVRDGARIEPGKPVRVASQGAVSPSLAALLGLDLLGAHVHPVVGITDAEAALAALGHGTVDAVLLRGDGTIARLASLQGKFRPLCTLGTPQPGGDLTRDRLAPTVPTLAEYAASIGNPLPRGPKYDAWLCAASAAQLRDTLVLPSLIPAAAVAIWRNAASTAVSDSLSSSVNIMLASAASALLRALSPGGAALLELRTWLAEQLGWRPGGP